MLSKRFRGFLPIVVDLETTGLDPDRHGVLELAAFSIKEQDGRLVLGESRHYHIAPFENAETDPKSSAIHQIDVGHPFRLAVSEAEALQDLFSWIRTLKKTANCQKSVLVGHNAWFDLSFLNAMVTRTGQKRNPFHPFTCFDTATLCALAYGQTVLAKACQVARIPFDAKEAHSALYDAEITAQVFCDVVNRYPYGAP